MAGKHEKRMRRTRHDTYLGKQVKINIFIQRSSVTTLSGKQNSVVFLFIKYYLCEYNKTTEYKNNNEEVKLFHPVFNMGEVENPDLKQSQTFLLPVIS